MTEREFIDFLKEHKEPLRMAMDSLRPWDTVYEYVYKCSTTLTSGTPIELQSPMSIKHTATFIIYSVKGIEGFSIDEERKYLLYYRTYIIPTRELRDTQRLHDLDLEFMYPYFQQLLRGASRG